MSGSRKQVHTFVGTRPGDPLADVVLCLTAWSSSSASGGDDSCTSAMRVYLWDGRGSAGDFAGPLDHYDGSGFS